MCPQFLAGYYQWEVIDGLHGSDHFPTLFNLLSNSIDQNSRRKWLIKKADWQLFRDSLTFNDDLTDDPDIDINDDINSFSNSIHKALITSIPKTKPIKNKKSLPWWSNELSAAL